MFGTVPQTVSVILLFVSEEEGREDCFWTVFKAGIGSCKHIVALMISSPRNIVVKQLDSKKQKSICFNHHFLKQASDARSLIFSASGGREKRDVSIGRAF